MFEVQADLGCHLQNRESTAPHRPRFLLNQQILEAPQIIKRQSRTLFAILLHHCLRLKTTKSNPLQVCQLKPRTSGANILFIRSLEQYCHCRSHHRPPLTKTAGKKVATTFIDFKLVLASRLPEPLCCNHRLYASSKGVFGHSWSFHSSCFRYLL